MTRSRILWCADFIQLCVLHLSECVDASGLAAVRSGTTAAEISVSFSKGPMMSGSFIPDDVARFIVEKIDSVAQLETLLLLRRSPEEQWSVQALASRVGFIRRKSRQANY